MMNEICSLIPLAFTFSDRYMIEFEHECSM